MSKSLRSMDERERYAAAKNRLRLGVKDKETGKTIGGLGYWGAHDAQFKMKRGVIDG